ncbi:hypothetical protein NL676_012150 [Syzygium grande]|nr:hypothetical protein NL676_012150 [Syzygium grande]
MDSYMTPARSSAEEDTQEGIHPAEDTHPVDTPAEDIHVEDMTLGARIAPQFAQQGTMIHPAEDTELVDNSAEDTPTAGTTEEYMTPGGRIAPQQRKSVRP